MRIEHNTVINNWVRTNIIGSFLFVLIIGITNGLQMSSIGPYLLLFLISLVLSHLVFLPKLFFIRYLSSECNRQKLKERISLIRLIIGLVLMTFLTLGILLVFFPKTDLKLFVSVGFSYLMPGIYLWFRSLIKKGNEAVLDENLLDDAELD